MTFPLGKPVLAMLIIATACAIGMALRPRETNGDMELWTFADSHARMFRGDSGPTTRPTLVQQYEQQTGREVNIKLIGSQAMIIRLSAIFDRDEKAADVPDLVEMEIGWVGRFFRPPLDHVGLLPLNDLLRESGVDKKILASRLAPWSKRGVIFGLPHDVHPVSITYRKDLFDEAGVDIASARTWPEFQEKCLQFEDYWRSRGYHNRRALELPSRTAGVLSCMLLQQHLNALDTENRSYLTDPRFTETIAFYARCVAGPKRISGEATPGSNLWVRDLKNGDLCAMVTPDWKCGYLSVYSPDLAGKVKMMPMPKFRPTDAPTATWGGTMLGIPKNAKNIQASWKLMQFLYLSDAGLKARERSAAILPPVIEAWNDPMWHGEDPFFCNQKVGELYIELARQLPHRYVTPFTTMAAQALSVVLNRAVNQVESGDEANLEANISGWLKEADVELRRRIEFGKFED